MRRWRTIWSSAALVVLASATCALPQQVPLPGTCARADFEAIVDGTGETLRALTQKNSPAFQAKLRALKDKRGWSHEQFLAEGARFVADNKISDYDGQSSTLLAKINGAGDEAGSAAAVDCARFGALKADLAALVAIQNEKWAYMFGNIDAELSK